MATADVLASNYNYTPTDYAYKGHGAGAGAGQGNGTGNGQASPTVSSNAKSGNGNGVQKVAYEDPNADVSLRSNEGRIFKVESYVLKTHR